MLYAQWKKQLSNLLEELPAVAEAYYGPRLVSLVVFGSVARGEATPESDIDLLVVLASRPSGSYEAFSQFYTGVMENLTTLKEARKEGVYLEVVPIFLSLEELRPQLRFLWDGRFRILFDPQKAFSRFVEERLVPFVNEHLEFRVSPIPHWRVVKPW